MASTRSRSEYTLVSTCFVQVIVLREIGKYVLPASSGWLNYVQVAAETTESRKVVENTGRLWPINLSPSPFPHVWLVRTLDIFLHFRHISSPQQPLEPNSITLKDRYTFLQNGRNKFIILLDVRTQKTCHFSKTLHFVTLMSLADKVFASEDGCTTKVQKILLASFKRRLSSDVLWEFYVCNISFRTHPCILLSETFYVPRRCSLYTFQCLQSEIEMSIRYTTWILWRSSQVRAKRIWNLSDQHIFRCSSICLPLKLFEKWLWE
jgi:hypothetical protein